MDTQCHGTTFYGDRCEKRARTETFGMPLCSGCASTAKALAWEWIDGNRDAVWVHIREATLEDFSEEIAAALKLLPNPGSGSSIVYFVERDGFIKIGTTQHLEKRLQDLDRGGSGMPGMTPGPVHLIATMRGDRRHEKYLHRCFGNLRVELEWFLPGSELCEFISRTANVVNWELLDGLTIEGETAEQASAGAA